LNIDLVAISLGEDPVGFPLLGRDASGLFIDKPEGKAVKLAFRVFLRWALA
jgi:hypothetical protein